MLQLALLVLLTVLFALFTHRALQKSVIAREKERRRLTNEEEVLGKENIRIKDENSNLRSILDQATALYDITKDICKTLDKEQVFNILREHVNSYINLEDCYYIEEMKDIREYRDYTVLPLMINKHNIGYLVAKGIRTEDKDKFNILAGQFLLGMKRALLYERIQELSIIDSLTDVFNRRYFLQRFREELARSEKFQYKFSFVMVDVDHFKSYNDYYGHLVGDAILRDIAAILKENLRQIDFIGRYGGEEFSLILTETDKEQARFATERIRRAVESRLIRAYDEDLRVTISQGVSVFPDSGEDAQALIEGADKAMYAAKDLGRNKVCIYGESGVG
ncbi:MAG: GGDEF domain-containing protein [Candidatus Omnitrophota bacterium]